MKHVLAERSWFENDGGESDNNDGESVEEGAGVSDINLGALGRAESRNKLNETRAGNGAQSNGDLERKVISMPNFVEGEEKLQS